MDEQHLAEARAAAGRQEEELRRRTAELAGSIAETEERAAVVLDESAALRPHAAGRLDRAARHARSFAAEERHEKHALEDGLPPSGPGRQEGPDEQEGPASPAPGDA